MIKEPLPKLLRNLREAAGLTIYSLAKESGISRAYISKLENGRSNPTLDSLKKLAKPLGMTLVDIVSLSEGPTQILKTNIREVEERVSKDKSFYSYPLSSRSDGRDVEIFYFKFIGIGEHLALRPSGASICIFVDKGELEFQVNDESIFLKPGDFIQTKVLKTYKYIQKTKKLASGYIVIRY